MINKMFKDSPYDVWFIADVHCCHKNILRHQKNRIAAMKLKDENDVEGHDKYIIEMWLSQTKRNDHIYVIGDFILSNKNTAIYILHKLKSNGCKIHLIVGNHDKATLKLDNLLESIDLIKVVDFKKSVFTFLDNDLPIVMCHYPMATWPRKCHGALHLFGHIHANSPQIDEGLQEGDLMLNVGLDTKLSGYKLINLREIYKWYKDKLNGLKSEEYIEQISKENKNFIR